MDDPTGLFRHYEQDPTLQSTAPNNMNPGFGSPSIDEINSITGYNSDWGADEGMPGPYAAFWNEVISGGEQVIAAGRCASFNDFSLKTGSYKGEEGTWMSYTYSLNDAVYAGFGKESKLSTDVIAAWFVPSNSSDKINDGEKNEDNLTWWDYTKTSVALAGAIVETAVGGLTAETGIGGVVAYDGTIRVAGNLAKLITMVETGKKSKSDLIPTNGGAVIGAIFDHGTDNHRAQAIGGTVNDILMLFVPHAQTDYTILNIGDEEFNGYTPNTASDLIDDYNSIQKSFK
jgi:hypothetical protein